MTRFALRFPQLLSEGEKGPGLVRSVQRSRRKGRNIMKKLRSGVLFALFVGTASYGLFFGSCAVDPKGSCAIFGFGPVQPAANSDVVANGDSPADPSDVGPWTLIF